MKKLKSWYPANWFRSEKENDSHASAHKPPVAHPRHISRRQTCDDQLSIRAGRQQRGSKAGFPLYLPWHSELWGSGMEGPF